MGKEMNCSQGLVQIVNSGFNFNEEIRVLGNALFITSFSASTCREKICTTKLGYEPWELIEADGKSLALFYRKTNFRFGYEFLALYERKNELAMMLSGPINDSAEKNIGRLVLLYEKAKLRKFMSYKHMEPSRRESESARKINLHFSRIADNLRTRKLSSAAYVYRINSVALIRLLEESRIADYCLAHDNCHFNELTPRQYNAAAKLINTDYLLYFEGQPTTPLKLVGRN